MTNAYPITLWCKRCGLLTPQTFEADDETSPRRVVRLTMQCHHCMEEVDVVKRFGDLKYYSESETCVVA